LKGGGELTYRFLNEYSADRIDIRIDAQDAKHISAERRAQLEESHLPHEREAMRKSFAGRRGAWWSSHRSLPSLFHRRESAHPTSDPNAIEHPSIRIQTP